MKQQPIKGQEQRNVKRRTDWQNSCNETEDKGCQVENTPWDEADNKAKSLIYLSLGSQATKSSSKDSHIQTYKNAQQTHSSNNSKKHSYKQELKHLIDSNFSVADRMKANR